MHGRWGDEVSRSLPQRVPEMSSTRNMKGGPAEPVKPWSLGCHVVVPILCPMTGTKQYTFPRFVCPAIRCNRCMRRGGRLFAGQTGSAERGGGVTSNTSLDNAASEGLLFGCPGTRPRMRSAPPSKMLEDLQKYVSHLVHSMHAVDCTCTGVAPVWLIIQTE